MESIISLTQDPRLDQDIIQKSARKYQQCAYLLKVFFKSRNSTVDSGSSAVDMINIPPNIQNVQEQMSENTNIHLPCQPEMASKDKSFISAHCIDPEVFSADQQDSFQLLNSEQLSDGQEMTLQKFMGHDYDSLEVNHHIV